MDRITILGMGPVGTSIGLALKRVGFKETEIVGTDFDRAKLKNAEDIRAVDWTSDDISAALDGSNLVVIDQSIRNLETLFREIGCSVKSGCVITDTGRIKSYASSLADEYLPDGIAYVGGRPLLRQSNLTMMDASASLFETVDYCVIPSESADREAVLTVVSMVETIGANPFFIDAKEHDTFDSAVRDLPIILSNVFVTVISLSPSWREMSRLAAEEFSSCSYLSTYDPQDSSLSCLLNGESLRSWIDRIIAELCNYRDRIKDESDELGEGFVQAWEQMKKWETQKNSKEIDYKLPSSAQTMAAMFLSKRLVERQRLVKDANKRPPWEYPGRNVGTPRRN